MSFHVLLYCLIIKLNYMGFESLGILGPTGPFNPPYLLCQSKGGLLCKLWSSCTQVYCLHKQDKQTSTGRKERNNRQISSTAPAYTHLPSHISSCTHIPRYISQCPDPLPDSIVLFLIPTTKTIPQPNKSSGGFPCGGDALRELKCSFRYFKY